MVNQKVMSELLIGQLEMLPTICLSGGYITDSTGTVGIEVATGKFVEINSINTKTGLQTVNDYMGVGAPLSLEQVYDILRNPENNIPVIKSQIYRLLNDPKDSNLKSFYQKEGGEDINPEIGKILYYKGVIDDYIGEDKGKSQPQGNIRNGRRVPHPDGKGGARSQFTQNRALTSAHKNPHLPRGML